LAYSIGQFWEVVAVGGHSEQLGAMKLQIADGNWKQTVEDLAHQEALIFMCPYNTPGVIWEIQYLRHARILDKAIFIMPPLSFLRRNRNVPRMEEVWSALINNRELRWAEIPSYFKDGCTFTLNNNGTIKDWDALGMEMLPWRLASDITSSPASRSASHSDIPSIPVGTVESLALNEGVFPDALPIIDLSSPAIGGGGSDSGWSAGDSGSWSSGGSGGDSGGGSGFGGDGGGSSGGGSGGGGSGI
jgi:hypothetical protein